MEYSMIYRECVCDAARPKLARKSIIKNEIY